VTPTRRPAWLIPVVAGVVILSPLAYSVGRFAWVSLFAAPKPFLQAASAPSGRCVRDAAWMRGNHRVFLRELRDKTVRDGIRNEVTLSSCSQCHKDKAQFCDKCHNAVNLRPDCFDCHSYSTTMKAVVFQEGKP
jgi:hypothetical protein